ncbi:hypothetical protein [Salinimicrobium sediminilitoris]|uniref:hypothetical protein n=1 Tax=Salinimicrobium sediminilitoris TaxID=2876715 RepID=UPI001E381A35|nr:hypothetical protein [Salinimicrobium sediminilitoris]MCC8358738.1 hypothetical protein [Salinimicrobium sediminilitoris]
MKKILLFALAIGLISCSKEELDLNETEFNELNAIVETYGCAGPDDSKTVTPQFVNENLYTAARIKRFYLDLLANDVSRNGTFNPTISEIATAYLDNPLGDFTTTYTVNDDICQDSVNLTLTVAEPVEDVCNANAGSDQTRTITPEFIQENLYTQARINRFFLNMLDEGVSETGTFNPTVSEVINDYLNNGLGTYTTTYTVGEGDCQDSTDLTLIIAKACDVNAGSDNTITVTPQYVDSELNTDAKIDRFFLNLLDEGISETGSFSPSIQSIKEQYIMNGNGTYTTTYTVGEGSCQDSAELTLIVEDACTINAGADKYVTVTNAFVKSNLYTAARIKRFYLNLLDAGVSKEGTFDPTISQIASSYLENNIGEFTTIYTVGSGDCQDTVDLTINIVE